MHWAVGVQSFLGRDDDVDEFSVSVLLHQGNDSADRMNIDIHIRHLPCTILSQVLVDRSLYDTIDHHISFDVACVLCPLESLRDRISGLLFGPERFCEYVEDGTDIGADTFLEFDHLIVGDLNFAVHMTLECSRVRHDHSGEI